MKANSPMTAHLMDMRKSGRLTKPSLSIHASVMAPFPGEGKPSEYERKEVKRLKSEISTIQEHLRDWDSEEVADRARRSLMTEMKTKKARLEECMARLEEMEDDQGKGKKKDKKSKKSSVVEDSDEEDGY